MSIVAPCICQLGCLCVPWPSCSTESNVSPIWHCTRSSKSACEWCLNSQSAPTMRDALPRRQQHCAHGHRCAMHKNRRFSQALVQEDVCAQRSMNVKHSVANYVSTVRKRSLKPQRRALWVTVTRRRKTIDLWPTVIKIRWQERCRDLSQKATNYDFWSTWKRCVSNNFYDLLICLQSCLTRQFLG